MEPESRILPEPPGPRMFRACDSCGRRFALVLVSSREDAMFGTLSTYECKYCKVKVTFAERHPDGAL